MFFIAIASEFTSTVYIEPASISILVSVVAAAAAAAVAAAVVVNIIIIIVVVISRFVSLCVCVHMRVSRMCVWLSLCQGAFKYHQIIYHSQQLLWDFLITNCCSFWP